MAQAGIVPNLDNPAAGVTQGILAIGAGAERDIEQRRIVQDRMMNQPMHFLEAMRSIEAVDASQREKKRQAEQNLSQWAEANAAMPVLLQGARGAMERASQQPVSKLEGFMYFAQADDLLHARGMDDQLSPDVRPKILAGISRKAGNLQQAASLGRASMANQTVEETVFDNEGREQKVLTPVSEIVTRAKAGDDRALNVINSEVDAGNRSMFAMTFFGRESLDPNESARSQVFFDPRTQKLVGGANAASARRTLMQEASNFEAASSIARTTRLAAIQQGASGRAADEAGRAAYSMAISAFYGATVRAATVHERWARPDGTPMSPEEANTIAGHENTILGLDRDAGSVDPIERETLKAATEQRIRDMGFVPRGARKAADGSLGDPIRSSSKLSPVEIATRRRMLSDTRLQLLTVETGGVALGNYDGERMRRRLGATISRLEAEIDGIPYTASEEDLVALSPNPDGHFAWAREIIGDGANLDGYIMAEDKSAFILKMHGNLNERDMSRAHEAYDVLADRRLASEETRLLNKKAGNQIEMRRELPAVGNLVDAMNNMAEKAETTPEAMQDWTKTMMVRAFGPDITVDGAEWYDTYRAIGRHASAAQKQRAGFYTPSIWNVINMKHKAASAESERAVAVSYPKAIQDRMMQSVAKMESEVRAERTALSIVEMLKRSQEDEAVLQKLMDSPSSKLGQALRGMGIPSGLQDLPGKSQSSHIQEKTQRALDDLKIRRSLLREQSDFFRQQGANSPATNSELARGGMRRILEQASLGNPFDPSALRALSGIADPRHQPDQGAAQPPQALLDLVDERGSLKPGTQAKQYPGWKVGDDGVSWVPSR